MYVFHIPPTHELYEEDSTLFRFGNPNLHLYLPLASSVRGRYNVLYDAYVCCNMYAICFCFKETMTLHSHQVQKCSQFCLACTTIEQGARNGRLEGLEGQHLLGTIPLVSSSQ